MYNKVPFNVVVPEYSPERDAPIFPHITKKYNCQENVAGMINKWGRLSWKIQQPDRSMVWTSVKLVLPMEIEAYDTSEDRLDMRVTSRRPACNMALSESPMNAFRQTTLSLNGKVFMEDNVFRKVLDTCYRGTGPESYGDNHSLKPVVCRDLQAPGHVTVYPILDNNDDPIGDGAHVNITDNAIKTLDNAFSLLEHNAPFLERARLWQEHLDFDGLTWRGNITNYLELGPFQARARKSNTAVPYIKDFHLTLNYDENPSYFDSVVGVNSVIPKGSRVVPAKLIEFGTIPNLRHHGETIHRTAKWPAYFSCKYSAKPYLEVTYTKFLDSMQPYYNLRCFEHQHENCPAFAMAIPTDSFESQAVVKRVTSRVLAYPTKIYLWASSSRGASGDFIQGGVRRSCLLSNIHCRINQRPDVVFNPSQESCFEMFQRHTNSSLEYGAWLKSPIYCFTPVDLGQSDMFANDARLTIFEWDAAVSLTPLQVQEYTDARNQDYLNVTGYGRNPTARKGLSIDYATDFGPPGAQQVIYASWDAAKSPALDAGDTTLSLYIRDDRSGNQHHLNCQMTPSAKAWWINKNLRISGTQDNLGNIEQPLQPEIIKIASIDSLSQQFRGFLWASVEFAEGADKGKIDGHFLFYIENSSGFVLPPGDDGVATQARDCIVPYAWIEDTPAAADDKGDPVHTYAIKAQYLASLNIDSLYQGRFQTQCGRKLFNVQGANGAVCTPGQTCFVTDAKGIRNNGGTSNHSGPKAAGSAEFPVLDQRTSTKRWVCFSPTPEMVAGTDKTLTWRGDTDGHETDAIADTLAGEQILRIGGQCDRNSLWDANSEPDEDLPMAIEAQNAKYNGQGFDMEVLDFSAVYPPSEPRFALNALYEYGNAQYQFTNDGMPTRVVPNLVPVDVSSAIPNLR